MADRLLQSHKRKWKYFASLATSCHVFRDISKKLYLTWADEHGDTSADKLAKKLWPKLTGGRWNSCDEVESRMLKIGGLSMMRPVLTKIFPHGFSEEPEQAASASTKKVVDELSFEETKEYTRRMGRWRARTLECSADALWWVMAESMRLARSPVTHLSALCPAKLILPSHLFIYIYIYILFIALVGTCLLS